jgi:hypothetical protein
MIGITLVVGPHELGISISLGAKGGSQIITGTEDFAGGSAVLPRLSEYLEIELSHVQAEKATLKCDYFWQVVWIVSGSVPTIREVHLMCLFMSLGRVLLQGSVSSYLVHPIRHHVDLQPVEVRI